MRGIAFLFGFGCCLANLLILRGAHHRGRPAARLRRSARLTPQG